MIVVVLTLIKTKNENVLTNKFYSKCIQLIVNCIGRNAFELRQVRYIDDHDRNIALIFVNKYMSQ